jgi:hypothetical protein
VKYRAAVVQLALLTCALVSPLRAETTPTIPLDFDVLRESTFKGCETFALTAPGAPLTFEHVTACVEGLAYYGLNSTSGLYGVSYSFWTTLLGTPPANTGVDAWMVGFAYSGVSGWPLVTIGSLGLPSSSSITSGVFYSPYLHANSAVVETAAMWLGHDGNQDCCTDDRFHGLVVTTTPEPSSAILIGSGLVMALVSARVRRRR